MENLNDFTTSISELFYKFPFFNYKSKNKNPLVLKV